MKINELSIIELKAYYDLINDKIKDTDVDEFTKSNIEQLFVYKWDYQYHKYERIGGNNAQ